MRKRLKTRLLALALAACTVLGLVPAAQASSIADGSKTCDITVGERTGVLVTTAGTTLRAAKCTYATNDGITGPAYCVNHGLRYASQTLPIAGKYSVSPRTAGAFAAGYPQQYLETFLDRFLEKNPVLEGLTEPEYAYATQLAVWATLGQLAIDGTQFTSGRERITQPAGDAQQMRVFRAVQIILRTAATWDRVYQTGMYIRLDPNALGGNTAVPANMTLEYAAKENQYGIKQEVINGKSYYTKEYIFASATSTYYQDYTIDLWATGAPVGTMFTDLNNVQLVGSKWHETDTWRLPVEAQTTNLNSNGYEFNR